jgi:hypothetical protein
MNVHANKLEPLPILTKDERLWNLLKVVLGIMIENRGNTRTMFFAEDHLILSARESALQLASPQEVENEIATAVQVYQTGEMLLSAAYAFFNSNPDQMPDKGGIMQGILDIWGFDQITKLMVVAEKFKQDLPTYLPEMPADFIVE